MWAGGLTQSRNGDCAQSSHRQDEEEDPRPRRGLRNSIRNSAHSAPLRAATAASRQTGSFHSRKIRPRPSGSEGSSRSTISRRKFSRRGGGGARFAAIATTPVAGARRASLSACSLTRCPPERRARRQRPCRRRRRLSCLPNDRTTRAFRRGSSRSSEQALGSVWGSCTTSE